MNEAFQLQPIGVPGELCIGGLSLSRGYLNRESLNAQKFINNPFGKGRLYRTGDLACWQADGNIDFIGRIDDQVKIRGFRIEPGEIEQALMSNKKIEQAALRVFGAGAEKYLVAYYTSEEVISEDEIRRFLSKRVPDHMIPSWFIQLDDMPYNASGKINRRALPKPVVTKTYIAPLTPAELQLADVWSTVLNEKQISADDNFFNIGGQSLKAIQVITELSKRYNVQLKISELFENPRLSDLAALVEKTNSIAGSSIVPVEIKDHYPLSHGQRRLWVLEQFEGMSAVYVLSSSFWLHGPVDINSLEKAFVSVIARHESLRTVFQSVNGEPRQIIKSAEETSFSISFTDCRSYGADSRDLAITSMEDEAYKSFDLASGPLLRVQISQTADETYLLTFSIHHIISDEWSLQVLIHEVLHIYQAQITSAPVQLDPLPIQYKDYVGWQQAALSGDDYNTHRNYWLQNLGGELPRLEFPSDNPRPPIQSYNGHQVRYNLPNTLSDSFQAFCKEEGVTLFMGLVTLVNILLFRYTGQEDIIVGSPIAGRDHPDLDRQIGYFVNTLPLRNIINGEKGFKDLLMRVKETTLLAFQHQVYPFDKLVDELNLVRDVSRAPVFDVVMVLQHSGSLYGLDARLDGVEVEEFLGETTVSKIDLRLFFTENEENITLTIDYNTDLFNQDRMERLARHLESLMLAVLETPHKALKEIAYLPPNEKEIILSEFNPLPVRYDLAKTMVMMMEEWASDFPDSPALLFGERKWTYQELNAQANKVAHHLRNVLQVKPDELIGVMTERNEWMIIALLGILKSGAAYMPVDPALPPERISFMLKDSGTKLVISESAFLYSGPQFEGSTLWLDIEADLFEENYENPVAVNDPGHLAYLIYTSGSTGTPKGVMIEHRSVINLINNQKNKFAVTPSDRVLQFSSISFDGSFFEFAMAFGLGASLVLVPSAISRDGHNLVAYMRETGVSVATLPSAFADALALEQLRFLRLLLLVGDVVNPETAVYCSQFISIHNGYGPTETTVWAADYKVSPGDDGRWRIPIGKPAPNTFIYIFDKALLPMPIGVPGEICITGHSLARGYLNRQELTNNRFIQNPFGTGKLYRTGDLGRWLSDGNIEFIGRVDNQVKIRGYRIEMDEIEKAMAGYDGIDQVAVTVHGKDNGKYLAGYFTAASPLPEEEIRVRLLMKLPEYMVPAFLIQLEAMPLNNSGKIDRAKLPVPGRSATKEFIAAQTATEIVLVQIWKEVLGLNIVSADDNFFALGGNSLKAVQQISQIYLHLGVQLSIGDVFNETVLSSLAVLIDNSGEAAYTSIPRVNDAPDYPLSYAQRRLWLQEQYRQGSVPYNAADNFVFSGSLNRAAFVHALMTLVERHESLRTVFETKNAETRQRILSPETSGFNVNYRDFRDAEQPLEMAIRLANQIANMPFDLEKGPLFRTSLFQTEDTVHVFAFSIHHIISDEWSMQVMVKELIVLYNAYNKEQENPLSPLSIQYRDFAMWEADELSGEKLTRHRDYWLQKLTAPLPVLQLPTDRPRPLIQTFNGKQFSFEISGELAKGLKLLCQRHEATLFMGLTALINTLLYQYTGQHDIIVGTPIADRSHPDLEEQIGYYLNTLALRTQLDPDQGFGLLLDSTRKNILEAFSHQVYPFDRLVEELNLEPDASRPPLFDVTVILQNIALLQPGAVMEGITVESIDVDLPISKGDIRFQFTEQQDQIDGNIEFNTDLFDIARIERMANHLRDLLAEVIADENAALHSLDYSRGNGQYQIDDFIQVQKTEAFIPVNGLFEMAVSKYPDLLAVEEDGYSISYAALNKKVNHLAGLLSAEYTEESNVVAVLIPSSVLLVEVMLSVFKAGLVYMPLDHSFSPVRLKQMFNETQSGLLITTQSNQDFVEQQINAGLINPLTIIYLPEQEAAGCVICKRTTGGNYLTTTIEDVSIFPVPTVEIRSESTNYIFYTSGSTGMGKGIMGMHRSLSHYVHWHAGYVGMRPGMRVS
ncbi:MAG: amino acid adenylation domain-containing protein, partial [Chitinophagaceae bacterium]|nr:amino acid adenylation domain-containing protein [Chitinophagaceae bacterium]